MVANRVNIPNILSLSRVMFLFILTALLYWPAKGTATAALCLFLVAALTDWADGYLARKFDLISSFGKFIDALSDKILIIGLLIALLPLPGLLPRWSVFLILLTVAREFLITGLRLVAASQQVVLAAEKGGKVKTVFQILAVSLLLLTHALQNDFNLTTTVLHTIGLSALALATLLTLTSGWQYIAKYQALLNNPNTHK